MTSHENKEYKSSQPGCSLHSVDVGVSLQAWVQSLSKSSQRGCGRYVSPRSVGAGDM